MSSSSSSPRETYEEDREYENQAKRLKTEEGEIDYSAEEGENRREATPRGGGDGGGGGGRSFSQPVTMRGAPTPVPGGSLGSMAQWRRLGPRPPARLVSLFCCAERSGSAGSSFGGFYSMPYLFSASRSRICPGLATGPGGSRLPALNWEGRGAGAAGRCCFRLGVGSGGFGRD